MNRGSDRSTTLGAIDLGPGGGEYLDLGPAVMAFKRSGRFLLDGLRGKWRYFKFFRPRYPRSGHQGEPYQDLEEGPDVWKQDDHDKDPR